MSYDFGQLRGIWTFLESKWFVFISYLGIRCMFKIVVPCQKKNRITEEDYCVGEYGFHVTVK